MAFFSEKLGLVTRTTVKDAEGFTVESGETITFVRANKKSIGQSEFYNADKHDLDAKCKFEMFSREYGGQKLVLYDNEYYNIYRTYQPKIDIIELYASSAKSEESYESV